MIDNLTLFISHSLILLACWRLLSRPDLDDDKPDPERDFFRPRPNPTPKSHAGEDAGDA
jgi:hypothetical protein